MAYIALEFYAARDLRTLHYHFDSIVCGVASYYKGKDHRVLSALVLVYELVVMYCGIGYSNHSLVTWLHLQIGS